MRVISLGWGVQSFGLVTMSAMGVLPSVDAAVHADTGHERRETYQFAAKWTPWLEERGVRVVTVQAENTRFFEQPEMNGLGTPPVFTSGRSDGQLRRSCTQRWKIAPIRRWLRQEGAIAAEQWIGISIDEVERRRLSDVRWITNVYPYLDFDLPIQMASRYGVNRLGIIQWLRDNGLDVPVKSSCVFCPYHNKAAWREIQLSGNGDWERALAVDEAIRHKRPGYVCFLTSARKPLKECDFRSQEEHGQLTLWEAEECSGNCFL